MATLFILIISSAIFALLALSSTPLKFSLKAGLVFLMAGAICGAILLITYWDTEILTLSTHWFTVGSMTWDFEIVLDALTVMMLSLVSLIGCLVYWYSLTYLANDGGKRRYFILLTLFLLSMYGLVISGNLFQLFFFWELVGFCSFGLIGFYYQKDYAAKAANKAFLINRIADLFLIVGLGLIFFQYNSLSLSIVTAGGDISFWAGLCLLLGACGKSAQYPFAIWLPDAMAGPTPVSAFIHAATMVTAGIILLARVYFILPPEVLEIMAFLGAITALLAAIVALVQHDIKKVLAYSTISQLGYMFVGMGTGAWDASLFHLFTHAFFKAGLFLNAGAAILWMKKLQKDSKISFDPQDMRNMGGLAKFAPIIFFSFTICTLALIGVPFFSGYLSKDAIISGAFAWAGRQDSFIYYVVPDLAFLTIILTAIYMIRMWSLVFLGKNKLTEIQHQIKPTTHKVGLGVKLSLGLLAILSVGFVVSLNPFDVGQNWIMPGLQNYLAYNPNMESPGLPAENHLLIAGISIMLLIVGAVIAWRKYRPSGSYHRDYNKYDFSLGYQKVAFSHYYLNSIYGYGKMYFVKLGFLISRVENTVIDKAVNVLGIAGVIAGHVIKLFDKVIIDGIINFSAFFAAYLGKQARSMTSGKLQGQLIAATLMFIVILMILIFNN